MCSVLRGRVTRKTGLDGPRLVSPRRISAVVCAVEQAERSARWLAF